MIVKAENAGQNESFKGCDPKIKNNLTKVVYDYDILFQEPKGLPPTREIQHDIHLQQDAPLPNIGMYRSSVIENANIKKQVQALLERGNIKPSSSLCG